MSLERTRTGTFDAHCDGCGCVVKLDTGHAPSATSTLQKAGWRRVGFYSKAHRPAFEWHCERCPAACLSKQPAIVLASAR